MALFSTISRHATLASLIAVTGLAAPIAQAQFKVEYSDSKAAPAAHTQTDEQRTVSITTDDGEHTYEVKLINGIVKIARVDGEALDHEQVKIKGESIVFIGQDGDVIHEFKVPAAPKAPGAVRFETAPSVAWVTQDQRSDAKPVEKPRVMLGINLTEPSDAMRKQLKLGADRQVILVEKVIEGLPAQKAGLEDYDVILSIDGSDSASSAGLTKVLRAKNPGDELKLVVLRGGEKKAITAKLSKYDAQKLSGGNIEVTVHGLPDLAFPAPPSTPDLPGGARSPGMAFGVPALPQIHERLTEALRGAGLSEEEIARVHEQLSAELGVLGVPHVAELHEHLEAHDSHESIGRQTHSARKQAEEKIYEMLKKQGLDPQRHPREFRSRVDKALRDIEEPIREAIEAHEQARAQGHGGGRSVGDLGRDLRAKAEEQLLGVLKESGVSKEQLKSMEGDLSETLRSLEERVRVLQEQHIVREKYLEQAQGMQRKAQEAMRDAQRQIMELRDGRLIVRSADQLNAQVDSQLETLESRMTALESRLESQMSRFERQMDRMAELFELMLSRLESGDED